MADDAKDRGAGKPANRFMLSLREALANARRAEDADAAFPNSPSNAPRDKPPGDRALPEARPAGLLPLAPLPLPPPPIAGPPAGPSAARFEPTPRIPSPDRPLPPPSLEAKPMPPNDKAAPNPPPLPSAAEAARAARGEDRLRAPVAAAPAPRAPVAETPTTEPATRIARREPAPAAAADPSRTVLVRGKQKVERGAFTQDPVVGWLVVVGGPGLGAYRPIFEGNNTVGRASSQRVPIDFGDDSISSEEQAYIRYDSGDRSFLLVPNLAKTNVVSLNSKKPTSAVPLTAMDVVSIGRTQLVFVPFCGPDFDWAELADAKS